MGRPSVPRSAPKVPSVGTVFRAAEARGGRVPRSGAASGLAPHTQFSARLAGRYRNRLTHELLFVPIPVSIYMYRSSTSKQEFNLHQIGTLLISLFRAEEPVRRRWMPSVIATLFRAEGAVCR